MFLSFLVFFIFLLFPQITSAGVNNGLSLIAEQVIPALYPFILITTFLKSKTATKNPPKFLLILLGFLSGYPLGAKIISEYWTDSSPIPPQTMLLICNNPSPSYMISYVGLHCLNNPTLGTLIYAAIIIGNITTGILLLTIHHIRTSKATVPHKNGLHITSIPSNDKLIQDTFQTMLNIASYILIFSVISAFIQHIPFIPKECQALFCGLLEMTSGIQQLASSDLPSFNQLLIITGISSFGGLSVIAQTHSMIQTTSLSTKKYITEKAIASTMAMSVMYLILKISKL